MLESTRQPKLALTALVICAMLAGCTDARIQRVEIPDPEPLDNLLEIRGEFCTEPSATVSFPLKVLFIVDQSASLQCTDSANRRFEALDSALSSLRRRPATEFAAIGFSSWSRTQTFTRNRDPIDQLLSSDGGLGPATDYQGSLATAVRMLEEDMRLAGPAERARTRYIINFVSDGVPEPRCNPGCEDDTRACSDGRDNDGDGIADSSDPDCMDIDDNSLHPDNLYGVCNTTQEVPEDVYVDMSGLCPEYNQPRQIQQRIQEIMALEDAYSIGDITLNTVLLFSPQDVVEGLCPGAGAQFGYRKDQARALLQTMANAGNGTFRDVNLAEDVTDFLTFEVTSIQADQTLTMMSAESRAAHLNDNGTLEPDSDFDGLSDNDEFALQTDENKTDTDNDRYSDAFEVIFSRDGFDPLDSSAPALPCDSGRDGDGDGLNDCEEEFIGTDPNQPDTDADGVLDRVELLAGLNPLDPDALTDVDFDGVLNLDEVRGGSNPLRPDDELYASERVVYDIEEIGLLEIERPDNGRMEERRCYDYTIERVPMVVTPLVRDRGLNRVIVTTSERPSQVTGVPGEFRVACFEAFYNGETIKSPESGIIDVTPERLELEREKLTARMLAISSCPYFPRADDPDAEPTLVTRADVTEMMNECVPRKVNVDQYLYKREDIEEVIARHIGAEGFPKIPARSFDLFVPMQNWRADQDCWRPWELDLVDRLLTRVEDYCNLCVEPPEDPSQENP